MNDLLHRDQTGTDDDLPWCEGGEGCTACAVTELMRDLAFYGDDDESPTQLVLGTVYYREGSRRGLEAQREEDACTMRAELYAESAWERYSENRWDEDAQRDLAWHNELWPTYYGCPTDPGAQL